MSFLTNPYATIGRPNGYTSSVVTSGGLDISGSILCSRESSDTYNNYNSVIVSNVALPSTVSPNSIEADKSSTWFNNGITWKNGSKSVRS